MPDTTAPEQTTRADAALSLLAAGVPLTLLLDLAGAVPSRELYREETADADWVPALTG
jgi:hypothetical protein